MITYTNVTFGLWEKQALDRVSLHLRIAFPAMNDPMPKNTLDRTTDHQARVISALVRDHTQGTHENVRQAVSVIERLVRVLAIESKLDHWLDIEAKEGTRPEPSEEPTSPYQQCRMLSDMRTEQMRDALKALLVLRQAARLTSPRSLVVDDRVPDDTELDDALNTITLDT